MKITKKIKCLIVDIYNCIYYLLLYHWLIVYVLLNIYTHMCIYTYEGGEEGIFSANRFNWDELILNNKA